MYNSAGEFSNSLKIVLTEHISRLSIEQWASPTVQWSRRASPSSSRGLRPREEEEEEVVCPGRACQRYNLYFHPVFDILKWCQRLTPLSRDEFWSLKMVNIWPFSRIFLTFNAPSTLLNESPLQNRNIQNRFFVNHELSSHSGVSETIKYISIRFKF